MPTTTLIVSALAILALAVLFAFALVAFVKSSIDGPTQAGQRAKVIAHSIAPDGSIIVTIQAVVQRFVLAELNTHRALNKNSASSRAIPFKKQLHRIFTDLAYPEVFPAEQKGMQGGGAIKHQHPARMLWWIASRLAVASAWLLAKLGVHKSVVNRILEPFMWHTVVLTGTAWENFFAQRCSPLAQPEIRVMAEAIRTAIENSTPRHLNVGEWHLPYVADDPAACHDAAARTRDGEDGLAEYYHLLAQISAARCARVSYETQEGTRDIDKDLELYTRLTTARPAHWSPLEHVATPWPENRHAIGDLSFPTSNTSELCLPHTDLPVIGNLLGWRSLRVEVESEQGMVTYR